MEWDLDGSCALLDGGFGSTRRWLTSATKWDGASSRFSTRAMCICGKSGRGVGGAIYTVSIRSPQGDTRVSRT
jgi:hypothetical protein